MILGKKKRSFTVYTAGAKVLQETAKTVDTVDDSIRQLAAEMLSALHVFDGIGLAAPQYGQSLRLVVFDVPDGNRTGTVGEALLLPKMPLAVINPEIIARSEETAERDEGCLSLPGIFAPVVRPSRVVFRAQTLDGEFIEAECGGLLGRCIQHELDHLDGILFSDRLTADARRKVRGDLDKLIRIGQTRNFRRNS